MSEPFVIQFSTLEEFIDEVNSLELPVIRVQSGFLGRTGGNSPCQVKGVVTMRSINPAEMAVLSCNVYLGQYTELFGRPFGPEAEHAAAMLEKRVQTAEEKIVAYLDEAASARITTGQISTGSVHPVMASWDGLEEEARVEALEDELTLAREALRNE